MMGCQNLAVPAEVMQHVVNVESSRNPYAIGVVGGQLVRQPQNLPEAVATVRMLEEKGYNYSLGVAQVNRANLGKYGLDSYEKAFDLCPNLKAGSQILAQCYASAGGDWGKAFSCYYSGNFVTGYQDGYVQKIFDSMARQAAMVGASPIPLQIASGAATAMAKAAPTVTTNDAAARVAMRSVADAALSAAIAPAISRVSAVGPQASMPPTGSGMSAADLRLIDQAQLSVAQAALQQRQTVVGDPTPPPGPIPTDPDTAAVMSQIGARLPASTLRPGQIPTDANTAAVMAGVGVSATSPQGNQAALPANDDNGVFVPQVRGPNDPAPTTGVPTPAPRVPAVDGADLRNGGGDGAFVF
ncbi:lytic transglycosylase domain-containing protein [Luteibacter sp. CQ10]